MRPATSCSTTRLRGTCRRPASWRSGQHGLLAAPNHLLVNAELHHAANPEAASNHDGHHSNGVGPQAAQPPAQPAASAQNPLLSALHASSPEFSPEGPALIKLSRSQTRRRGGSYVTIDEAEDAAGSCAALWDEHGWYSHLPPVRAELLQVDPGLNQSLISSGTSVAQIFNQDLWERHRRSDRYWLYMRRMVHSTILRRVFRPCLVFSWIALAVSAWNSMLPAAWPKLGMSLVPHTLLGAALSLLLVFRTNSSHARFVEGRMLWGSLVRYSRDWIRLVTNYLHGEMRGRAIRYVQVLAFVLKSRLRAGRTRADPSDPTAFRDDPTAVVQELLSKPEAEAVMAQSNRPFYMICRMTSLVRDASCCGTLPHHVLDSLEHALSEMNSVVGGCDRILGTPIPLSYTRHTSRSLVMWLATLPLGLWPVMGWLSVPSMFLIAFIFLGIDEIGVEIEEPFCLLPLLPMVKSIVEDANTAMAMAGASAAA